VNEYKWELYNVADDYSEANDLAAKEPRKLRELQDLFWAEAGKYNVLPIDNSKVERFDVSLRPSLTRGRTEFTYYPGMIRIPEGSAPDFKNKSYRIIADVQLPAGGAEGVLLTQGGRFNGLGLYLLQGRPVFHYNLVGVDRTTIAATNPLTPGKHIITLDFKYDGGGIGKGGLVTLAVDGKEVANGKLMRTIPFRVSADETLDIGEDTGTPVSEDYHVPFKFTGVIDKVVVDLGEAKLSPQDQKELDEKDGANEIVD
jgi:arylsulfatase